jgi:hypothetical protein
MSWRWILIAGWLAGCGKSPLDKNHLIDRELFFGNPALASPQVSPDGRWVAFLKERNGILNLHLVGWGETPDQARPLTDEKERPPAGFTWTRDSRYLLVSQDSGGDENYRLRRLDLSSPADPATGLPTAAEVPLKKGVRAMVMALPKARPGEALANQSQTTDPASGATGILHCHGKHPRAFQGLGQHFPVPELKNPQGKKMVGKKDRLGQNHHPHLLR